MPSLLTSLLLLAGFGGDGHSPVGPAESTGSALTGVNFAELHAMIKPQTGEDAWAEIPWQINLWEARKRAAADGKPIFLWEMDGHPLGCV